MDTKSWTVNLKSAVEQFHTTVSGAGADEDITLTLSANVTATLMPDGRPNTWSGPIAGTVTIEETRIAKTGNCTFTTTIKATKDLSKNLAGGNRLLYLTAAAGGASYALYGLDWTVSVPSAVNGGVCGSSNPSALVTWLPSTLSTRLFAVPASSSTLQNDTVVNETEALTQGNRITVPFHLTWTAVPSGQTEIEILVDPKGYDTWRPSAVGDELGPGNAISLEAKLQKTDGTEPAVKARKFTWELTFSSAEPGIAINFPVQPVLPPPFDLSLEPADNPSLKVLDDQKQRAQSQGADLLTSSAIVRSHDWGAYGRVRVTAELNDGRILVGHLRGDAAQTEIRLPKRREDSAIADVWRNSYGAQGALGPDDADDERDPVGDGHLGDGLTLYEEYRGFYEEGQHQEGDPFRKDLFISDNTGGEYVAGILLFESITGLNVHSRIRARGELPDSRVINGNHAAAAHRVDQHAITIRKRLDGAMTGQAVGGPGTPGKISELLMPGTFVNPPDRWGANYGTVGISVAYADQSLAHELAHAVNISHHGNGDYQAGWIADTSGDQPRLLENAQPIRVLVEDQTDITAKVIAARLADNNQPFPVWVGVPRGEHSGVQECILRYDCASAYVSKTDPSVRYWIRHEGNSGVQLCSSPAGTGVNDAARLPQPRYGDAGANHPLGCAPQLCVNDAYDHPVPR